MIQWSPKASYICHGRRVVGDMAAASVAHHAVQSVGAAPLVERRLPGQHHCRLVHKVHRDVLWLAGRT